MSFSLRKIVPAVTLAASLTLGLFTTAQATTILKFAHVYDESTPYHKVLLDAARAIKEQTDDRYEMQVFPSSSLGNEEAINEGLSLGTIDLIYTGPAFMAQSYPEIGILDYPFVFRDFDHWQAFWNSALRDEMAKGYQDATGNVLITHTYYGTRQVTANKPILKPSDMKGLKIRVPNAPAYTLFPTAVGANPTPMAFSEVYLGLQQGVVDAEENPLPTIKAAQFYEVQSDISLTSHTTATLTTIMSGVTNDSLSDQDRKIIFAILKDASAKATQDVRDQEASLVAWFKGKGVNVHDVDRQPFMDIVQPLLQKDNMPWSPETFKRLEAIGQ
ncbi:sialic acid TRAP transporter substrate-binding protein SiaP [Thalassospira mesophila]|uniref:ABC transporter substrate-binding protein n=1 Tax=Thalassospira mesophila TaxID=1293891 RepID=A0A1Y2KWX7_9PROT|nr:sialic acid TRAP transporter substrate-binding protein SiaP [Thalassospira mesophila]OSQ36725.1 ABC transporter substrate-binding protein [Thalassospira mesophila]